MKVLTIHAFDVIGNTLFGDGVTAKTVAAALEQEPFDSIHLRINSPGGDPFEAVAISSLLKSTGKPVVVSIDGLAASAASALAMVGDEIQIAPAGMLMIHAAMAAAFGNATDLRKLADTLDKLSGTIVDTYAGRTNLPADQIKQMMAEETWFTAQEAVAKGFADKIAGSSQPVAKAHVNILRGFKNLPVELKNLAYTNQELAAMRLKIA